MDRKFCFLSLLGVLFFLVSAGNAQEMRQVIKVFKINHILASELLPTLKTVLSSKGKIVISKTRNSVIVMDYQKNVDSVWTIIQELDQVPQNVKVSVEFVEESALKKLNLKVSWLFKQGLWQIGTFCSSDAKSKFGVSVDAELLESGVYSLNRQFLLLEDGTEGRIFVGRKIPFHEVFADDGIVIHTTQYRDLGSGFLVKPTILADNRINLSIVK